MAYKVIADKCTGCGACVSECPSQVISAGDDAKSVIDENQCVECGACADACPSEAIVHN